MTRILLLLAHSIEEYDQVRLLHSLGYDVFSIGAYTNPAEPADNKRPPLPDVPYHADLAKLVEGDQMRHKASLPPELIEWADIIIAHHFVYDWIAGQWAKIRHKRVIWRTVGQTAPQLEQFMSYLRPEGLEIVRYSPREKENGPSFAGEDAMIRFYKDPDEWEGWTGHVPAVGNITQDMAGRGESCGYSFWLQATQGLPVRPAGPGSKAMPNGIGELSYDAMRQYLRAIRCYLYTGTTPAPYTLGLIEAMMTGTPVVSIGPTAWGHGHLPGLFEGHEIATNWSDDPGTCRAELSFLLDHEGPAREASMQARQRAIDLFGMEKIGAQWKAYLG